MNAIKYVSVILLTASIFVFAADDPSIKGKVREGVTKAMENHIQDHMVDGKYFIYDAALNKLRVLKFEKLHSGIVKKGNFYVSCADFSDDQGLKYDLDYFVLQDGKKFKFIQAIVHKVNGDKRPYSLVD